MSVSQKMFACCGCMFIIALAFTQAIPVPAPEEALSAENRLQASSQIIEYEGEPAVSAAEVVVDPVAAGVVRPVRSPSPFFGIITSYEKPKKTQHHHHHHYHHEEPEPEHHHHHYHNEEHKPHYHKPQHHNGGGGGAGSFASAGSFAGGSGSGSGHSQSQANSQSASFGFGPFQASYSASAAHSGSHFGPGF